MSPRNTVLITKRRTEIRLVAFASRGEIDIITCTARRFPRAIKQRLLLYIYIYIPAGGLSPCFIACLGGLNAQSPERSAETR